MAVLSGNDIRKECEGDNPLIRNFVDFESQLQQNGFDLTLKKVETFCGYGAIDFDNKNRELPDRDECESQTFTMRDMKIQHGYFLRPGAYLITFNEIVNIRKDLMARACPRSSLMRSGAGIDFGMWDAGYEGQSQALLVVYNKYGLLLYKNAKVAQIAFETLTSEVENGYSGRYHREGIQ